MIDLLVWIAVIGLTGSAVYLAIAFFFARGLNRKTSVYEDEHERGEHW